MTWEKPATGDRSNADVQKTVETGKLNEGAETNIEKLKGPVERLNMLLNDPQPGLSTWQEAAQTNMREVRDEINKILGTEESEE